MNKETREFIWDLIMVFINAYSIKTAIDIGTPISISLGVISCLVLSFFIAKINKSFK